LLNFKRKKSLDFVSSSVPVLYQVFYPADGRQEHFLSITTILKNYDFEFPYHFLFSVCDPAVPYLRICGLYFSPESGNDNAGNSGTGGECNCDKKFCFQPGNAHGKNRINNYLDKPGHSTPPGRF
jgi:hypothetical protein